MRCGQGPTRSSRPGLSTSTTAVLAMVEGRLDEGARAAAAHEAHRLAGTLGMFGLVRATEAARKLEVIFLHAPVSGAPIDTPSASRAAELAEILVLDIEAAGSLAARPPDPAGTGSPQAGTASAGTVPPPPAAAGPSGGSGSQAVVAAQAADGPVAEVLGGDGPEGDDPAGAGKWDVDVTVVEDDEILAELLRQSLEAAGMRCELIHDGLEAQRRLAGIAPTLTSRVVLLDLDLPSRGGAEVLRSMRESGVLERTSVIVLTARATEADILLALNEGATDHIAKPFSVPVLVAKLQRLLRD